MKALNRFFVSLYAKALQVREEFLKEERGAVDIVAIVVMIGIAVALAVVFRESIGKLLTDLFKSIGDSASSAIQAY